MQRVTRMIVFSIWTLSLFFVTGQLCLAAEDDKVEPPKQATQSDNKNPTGSTKPNQKEKSETEKTKPDESTSSEADSGDLLQKIIDTRLSAKQLTDLGKVIDLCQQALDQKNNESDREMICYLMASTLVQRAEFANQAIFNASGGKINRNWPSFRKLALADLNKAIELVPEFPEARLMIARLNVLPGGDADKAKQSIEKGLAIENIDPDIRANLLALSASFEKDPEARLKLLDEAIGLSPGQTKHLKARILVLIDSGKTDRAIEDLRKAIELQPKDASNHEDLSRLLASEEKFDESLKSLDEAERLGGATVLSKVIRSRIFSIQGDKEKAIEQLDEAHILQPNNPFVLLLRASLLDESEQTKKALADIDQVLKLQADNRQAINFRIAILAKLERIDEAIADIEKLLSKTPDQPVLQLQLALLFSIGKQNQKALDAYSAIIKNHPDNVEALRGRANTYLGIGKHSEAADDFAKAYEKDPDEPNMLNNYAWLISTSPEDSLRNGKLAIELATKACELTKYKEAHILSTLGAAYAETGNFEKAIEFSKKAVELAKKNKRADIQSSLEKELESYQAKKPWRELLTEGLDDESDADQTEKKTPTPEKKTE
jgi:tetratricopeptide (TPR) repeat protein